MLIVVFLFLFCIWNAVVAFPKSKPYTRHNYKGIFDNLKACKTLVIWDCDGVLVDSEALLKQGEVEALTTLGFDLSVEDCVRLFSGVSPDKAMKNFEEEFKKPLPENFFKEQIEGNN